MRTRVTVLVFLLGLGSVATGVEAAFRVAELVYVPVVANTTGANDSHWKSDVIITNVEAEDTIDVAMVFLPSGLHSNAAEFYDRTSWVGGRESDSFGILDEQLADIPPGGSVKLNDVVESYWPDNTGLNQQGALFVFAYLADSLEDDGTADYRDIAVTSRTFNTATVYEPDPDNEGEYLASEVTYGQSINGVPWYDAADAAYVSDQGDFSYVLIDGGQSNDTFRYNLGLVNTSDQQTTVIVKIEPIQPDGEPFTDADGAALSYSVSLPPLAHVQYFQVLRSLWGLTDVDQARLKVSIAQWSTTGTDPHPTFIAYGSLVDNTSNDPTTFESTFSSPYNLDCMWPTPDTGGNPKADGPRRSPLDIPPVW